MATYQDPFEHQANALLKSAPIVTRRLQNHLALRRDFYESAIAHGLNETTIYDMEAVVPLVDQEQQRLAAKSKAIAAKLSPIEWLWHLRTPDPRLLFTGAPTTAWFTQEIAAVMTAEDHPEPILNRPLERGVCFEPDIKSVIPLVDLAAIADLSHDHFATRNMAHRGFEFKLDRRGWLVVVNRRESQAALDDFDRRLFGAMMPFPDFGTVVKPSRAKSLDEYQFFLPATNLTRKNFPFAPHHIHVPPFDQFSGFSTYGSAVPFDIREVASFSDRVGHTPWPSFAVQLLLCMYLKTRSAYHHPQEWVHFVSKGIAAVSTLHYGAFEKLYARAIDLFSSLFKDVDFFDSADQFLKCIEAAPFSVTPFNAGPVMRRARDHIAFDLSLCHQRLGSELGPTVSNTEDRRIFTRDFENTVQRLIDDSDWKPTLCRSVIGKELKLDGRPLTDVDALGENGKRLLLVSCKTSWKKHSYGQRTFNEKRNVESALAEYVLEHKSLLDTLRKHPVGDNYDFTAFDEIDGVVCTPVAEWVDGPTRDAKVWGLRVVCSFQDLGDWLAHESSPGN